MVDRTCRICDALIIDISYHAEGSSQRCCSMDCLRTHWRLKAQRRNRTQTKTSKPCRMCGQPTEPKAGRGRDRIYCSESCRILIRTSAEGTPISVRDCDRCGAAFVAPRWYNSKRCATCTPIAFKAKQRASAARHRARKVGAAIEQFTNDEIYERDGWRCGLCGKLIHKAKPFPHPMSRSIDHVVPLSKGGDHSRANVQAAHYGCNSRKNNGVLDPQQLRLV